MDTGIHITGVHIPSRQFQTGEETPVLYRIYFAHMAPPENVGNAGDFFIELAVTPMLYVKTGGGRQPRRIAWRWVQEENQVIQHPSRPDLCASGPTCCKIPIWAPEQECTGDLHLAAKNFVEMYGHGGHLNPIDLTIGP